MQIVSGRQADVPLSSAGPAVVGVVGSVGDKVMLDVRPPGQPTGSALVPRGGALRIGSDVFSVTADTAASTGNAAVTVVPTSDGAAAASAVTPSVPTPAGQPGQPATASQGTRPTVTFGSTAYTIGVVSSHPDAVIFSFGPLVPTPGATPDARSKGTHFLKDGDATTIGGTVVLVHADGGGITFTPYAG